MKNYFVPFVSLIVLGGIIWIFINSHSQNPTSLSNSSKKTPQKEKTDLKNYILSLPPPPAQAHAQTLLRTTPL